MSTQEIEHQRQIINLLKKRLHSREMQSAMYGLSVDPSIMIEIEDLKKRIDELERQVSNSPNITTSNNVIETKATSTRSKIWLFTVPILALISLSITILIALNDFGNSVLKTVLVVFFGFITIGMIILSFMYIKSNGDIEQIKRRSLTISTLQFTITTVALALSVAWIVNTLTDQITGSFNSSLLEAVISLIAAILGASTFIWEYFGRREKKRRDLIDQIRSNQKIVSTDDDSEEQSRLEGASNGR